MSHDPFSAPQDPINPYAPTTVGLAALSPTEDVEAYRRKYLNHEASVKSIGVLYFIGALFMIPVSLFFIGGGIMSEPGEGGFAIALVGLVYLTLGSLQLITAIGLRRLRPWARIIAIIFSVIGLLGVPVGTLICGYFLYLLLSEKGQIVFSAPYKEVIAQTPHIRYKTSIIVWIFLLLVVVLIGFALLAPLLTSSK